MIPTTIVGAEAVLDPDTWHGRPVMRKRRVRKGYRDPALDERIRRERLRTEALVLAEARRAGVRVPIVYDVDTNEVSLVMERIAGPTLRELLATTPQKAGPVLVEWGRMIGRLHTAGLVHGDLTTSNVLVDERGPVLIDFGLSQRSPDVEDQGVDLVLVQRTLESSHPRDAVAWFDAVVLGYAETNPASDPVLRRMREIRGRARYA